MMAPQARAAAQRSFLIDSKADLPLGRQLSPLNARLKDGRTIEEAYQQAKGYPTAFGPQGGKGKPAIDPNFDYEGTYRNLYRQFADENPEVMNELALVLHPDNDTALVHPRARTTQNPAIALTEIINERRKSYPDLAEQFYGAQPGQHRPALFFEQLKAAGPNDAAQGNTLYQSLPGDLKQQVGAATGHTPSPAAGGAGGSKPPGDLPPTGGSGPESAKPPRKIPGGMAGVKLASFLTSPLGEEVLEGVLGGTMVMLPQFFSEEDQRENLLQWGLSMAGGVGIGMAGRRIGANLGKRFHGDEIKNPTIAMMARGMGEETISKGMANTIGELSAMNGFGSLQQASRQLKADLSSLSDPLFRKAYPQLAERGVLPSTISQQQLDTLTTLQDEIGLMARRNVETQANDAKQELGGFKQKLTEALADESADLPPDVRALGSMLQDRIDPDAISDAILGKKDPVTGEHVGRAIGRFIGDEVGIMGGLLAGGLIANQLGWQSPKDKQIESLQKQLAQA
jgi:hypothetical protein